VDEARPREDRGNRGGGRGFGGNRGGGRGGRKSVGGRSDRARLVGNARAMNYKSLFTIYCFQTGAYGKTDFASVTKRGLISRVTCPKCGTRSSFSNGTKLTGSRSKSVQSEPYDMSRTYRTGQVMIHPMWGPGEVTAVIEPKKIDVLFADRIRRLIHSRAEA